MPAGMKLQSHRNNRAKMFFIKRVLKKNLRWSLFLIKLLVSGPPWSIKYIQFLFSFYCELVIKLLNLLYIWKSFTIFENFNEFPEIFSHHTKYWKCKTHLSFSCEDFFSEKFFSCFLIASSCIKNKKGTRKYGKGWFGVGRKEVPLGFSRQVFIKS